jgi:hypothetical protein
MSNILHLHNAQHSTNDKPEPVQIVCSACGATADAACACGAPYLPAGARAADAIAKNPEMSDRAIGDAIGVDHKTVAKARKATGDSSPVQKRTGKDGKARRLPAKPAAPLTTSTADSIFEDLFEGIFGDRESIEPTTAESSASPAPTTAEQIGEFLEHIGADRFFAALQHAPKIKAEIEHRLTSTHPVHDDPGGRNEITKLALECRAHLHNPKPANVETVLKKLARIANICAKDKVDLDTGAFRKGMDLPIDGKHEIAARKAAS